MLAAADTVTQWHTRCGSAIVLQYLQAVERPVIPRAPPFSELLKGMPL